MRRRSALALSAFLAAAALEGPLAAQPAPLGPETRVDVPSATIETSENPSCPFLGVRPDGSFQIAWDYGGSLPIYVAGRNYISDGTPTGSQLRLASRGYYPEVDSVRQAPGGFEVLFHIVDDLRPERPAYYLQRLDLLGRPDGPTRRLGSDSYRYLFPAQGTQHYAGRMLRGDRGLVLRWIGSRDRPEGPEIRVTGPVRDIEPDLLALAADGRMVLVWTGFSPDGRQVLRARRLNVSARPEGPEFNVNTIPLGVAGGQPTLGGYGAVAAPDGGFAVVWNVQQGERFTIYVRFFDSGGDPLGPEVEAVTVEDPYTVGIGAASAAFDGAGDLFLLWHHRTFEPLDSEMLARIVGADGTLGPEFPVRSNASRRYPDPLCGSVKWVNGTWIVTWMAGKNPLFDPSALFVRRFDGD